LISPEDTARQSRNQIRSTKSEIRQPEAGKNQNDQNPNDLNKFKNETVNLLNKISRN
jgi:hypothetical protein